MDETKGFFGALFDFTFSDFVTTKIVKVLYVLWIIAAVVGALFAIVAAFGLSAWLGLLMLIVLAPLGFVIAVIYGRVCLEIIIVIFRIAENTSDIANYHLSEKSPGTP